MKPDSPFQTQDEHWWSMNDRQAVVDTVRRLKGDRAAFRVLEFGPGWSTRALFEGGATSVDSCEDNPDWAQVHEVRLPALFPGLVRILRYAWSDPLTIPGVDGARYDLALIDGPLGTDRRAEAARYALARCAAVLAPTETKNRAVLVGFERIAADLGWDLQVWETGPLSGGFALFTPAITSAHAPESVPAGRLVEASSSVDADPETVSPAIVAPKLSRRERRQKAKAGQS